MTETGSCKAKRPDMDTRGLVFMRALAVVVAERAGFEPAVGY